MTVIVTHSDRTGQPYLAELGLEKNGESPSEILPASRLEVIPVERPPVQFDVLEIAAKGIDAAYKRIMHTATFVVNHVCSVANSLPDARAIHLQDPSVHTTDRNSHNQGI